MSNITQHPQPPFPHGQLVQIKAYYIIYKLQLSANLSPLADDQYQRWEGHDRKSRGKFATKKTEYQVLRGSF